MQEATVHDLLMARSGIYHPAAYETGGMRRNRPERSSHAPSGMPSTAPIIDRSCSVTLHPNTRRIPDGLETEDDAMGRLETLMVDQDIPSAMLSGFGFVGQITFGFFDFEAREYKPNSYENPEVTNLKGSLAWKARKTAAASARNRR
jgi:hypothetical protein